LTVHLAYFTASGTVCYFINATNLSSTREIELTHAWFAVDPPVYAMPPDRPLPKRLKPDETWETWVEATRLPPTIDEAIYELARAQPSTGRVVRCTHDHDVPEFGTVPGGPIMRLTCAWMANCEELLRTATRRLGPDTETAVFRIVQEALGNTLKYAQATAITVSLTEHAGQLVARVTDDGVGFDPALPVPPSSDGQRGGSGLRSMRARAAAVGMKLQVESTPGAGTSITVTAPFPE
jgi:anti-sigma regulatory factor (Ser/Thr protein kinase)